MVVAEVGEVGVGAVDRGCMADGSASVCSG